MGGLWPSLYFQFVAHAARNEEFRQELATRHQAMRERMGVVFTRWKQDSGAGAPAVPAQEVAAMMFFMADGFLLDRIIEPDLSDELFTTMVGVFVRGLEALSEEQAGG